MYILYNILCLKNKNKNIKLKLIIKHLKLIILGNNYYSYIIFLKIGK